jgi:methylenetetrahydrofolate dehydrogenase (NADP+)/methenyltetrahydrofolate cyclohydrolase
MTGSATATVVVDGKALAQTIRAQLAEEIAELVGAGHRAPCLAVVLVGDNPASLSYIKGKRRACERVGMASREHDMPANATQEDVVDLVQSLNRDPHVDGILVQLPLPKPLQAAPVIQAIDPAKDADGLHPENAGRLLAGLPGLRPCTPLGILEVLDRHGVALEGTSAVVIGRSVLVGKPIALLLLERNATVTICHSRTKDLPAMARTADILVAAIGRPAFVTPDFVKPGAVVIDVGINSVTKDEEAQRIFAAYPARLETFKKRGSVLVGDVHPDVAKVAGALTPVPGGVGPLTIAMLMANTVKAAELRSR